MDRAEGQEQVGFLLGSKTKPAKYNGKGERTADSTLVITLEFPNDPGLAQHIAKLLRDDAQVAVTIERKQRELALGDQRGPAATLQHTLRA